MSRRNTGYIIQAYTKMRPEFWFGLASYFVVGVLATRYNQNRSIGFTPKYVKRAKDAWPLRGVHGMALAVIKLKANIYTHFLEIYV